jgi:hypothetical protein
MFFENPSFYPFRRINREATALKNPVKIHRFQFQAKHRKYEVLVEEYTFGVHAIKYCGLKDRKSKKAYSMVYNDGDGIKVISTCLQIMLYMWKENPGISFAFFAVPRVGQNAVNKNRKARYNIYESAMQNLFSPKDFRHYMDRTSFVYVLLNKSVRNKRATIEAMGKYLLSEYQLIFAPYLDSNKKTRSSEKGMRFG